MTQVTVETVTVNINGVNVNARAETIAAAKNVRELAKFKFSARNHWINNGPSQSTMPGFYGCKVEDITLTTPFVLDTDELLLLEEDAAPT